MLKNFMIFQYIAIVRTLEIIILVMLILIAYNFVPISTGAIETIYIDASSNDSIVESLESNGYTVTPLDKMMILLDHKPKSGWYRLTHNTEDRYKFFKNIYKKTADTMQIVIFSGETNLELINRLANDTNLNKKLLLQEYNNLKKFQEANIFSGHYIIAKDVKEKNLINFLFTISNETLKLFIKQSFSTKPSFNTINTLIIKASIIQKETNNPKEMSKISSVIENRLTKGMKLQMDATLNYGKYSHKIVTPERIKSDTSRFNTYKYKGLPPYALGTISLNALNAAKFPNRTKYLFFVLQPKGGHIFSENYEKHLASIKKYKKHLEKSKNLKKEKEIINIKIQKNTHDSNISSKDINITITDKIH